MDIVRSTRVTQDVVPVMSRSFDGSRPISSYKRSSGHQLAPKRAALAASKNVNQRFVTKQGFYESYLSRNKSLSDLVSLVPRNNDEDSD